MNEVTLAVAAKVTFCSGILRFLTPGLKDEYFDLCKRRRKLTLLVQLGQEDWQERMDHLREARRICTDLHFGFISLHISSVL